MDVVVIPCFDRPEYLSVTLELIQSAYGAEKLHYLFCLDSGYSEETLHVAEKFPLSKTIFKTPRKRVKLTKQSYNVLNGLAMAARNADRYVFLIEDDIFIANDFFQWHYLVQQDLPLNFCTIATRNNNTKFATKPMMEGYYISTRPDYQSLGVCYNKEVIKRTIMPHINDQYLTNPVNYCMGHFPKSTIGRYFVEQDGLIRRILEAQKILPSVFPHVARAYHAGVYGKNRGHYPRKKSLHDRIDWVVNTCFDNEAMRKAVVRQDFYDDSTPVPLVNKPLEKVKYIEANAC